MEWVKLWEGVGVGQGVGLKEDPTDADPHTLARGVRVMVPLRVGSTVVLLAGPVAVSRVVIVRDNSGERVAIRVVLADTERVLEADPQWVPPIPTPKIEGVEGPLALTMGETLR